MPAKLERHGTGWMYTQSQWEPTLHAAVKLIVAGHAGLLPDLVAVDEEVFGGGSVEALSIVLECPCAVFASLVEALEYINFTVLDTSWRGGRAVIHVAKEKMK